MKSKPKIIRHYFKSSSYLAWNSKKIYIHHYLSVRLSLILSSLSFRPSRLFFTFYPFHLSISIYLSVFIDPSVSLFFFYPSINQFYLSISVSRLFLSFYQPVCLCLSVSLSLPVCLCSLSHATYLLLGQFQSLGQISALRPREVALVGEPALQLEDLGVAEGGTTTLLPRGPLSLAAFACTWRQGQVSGGRVKNREEGRSEWRGEERT